MSVFTRAATAALFLLSVQSSRPAQSQSSDSLFVFERDIRFDEDEVFLGDIRDVVIGPDGEILIVGWGNPSAILFDRFGKLIKELDPTPCNPGASFYPFSAVIGPNKIFVNSDGPWGLIFNRDGTCDGQADDTYAFLLAPTVLSDDRFVGVRRVGPDLSIVTSDFTGKTLETVPLPEREYPQADSRGMYFGLASNDEEVVYVPSVSPVLYHIRNGKISSIDRDIFFKGKAPIRDYPERIDMSKMQDIRKLTIGAPFNNGASFLSDGRLFLRYTIDNKPYWVFLDPDNPDDPEVIDGWFWIAGFHNDRIYTVIRPEMHDDGFVPNQYLKVYRYTRGE